MHGVTFWKNIERNKEDGIFKLDISRDQVSNLYTWQDGRCDPEFLKSLPNSESHLAIHTGFGCATLFWFSRNKYVYQKNLLEKINDEIFKHFILKDNTIT